MAKVGDSFEVIMEEDHTLNVRVDEKTRASFMTGDSPMISIPHVYGASRQICLIVHDCMLSCLQGDKEMLSRVLFYSGWFSAWTGNSSVELSNRVAIHRQSLHLRRHAFLREILSSGTG